MESRTQCEIWVLLGAWRASQDDKQKAAESLAALNTWLTSHANLDNTIESRQDEKQKGGTVNIFVYVSFVIRKCVGVGICVVCNWKMCGGERWYMWAHKKSVLLVPIFCRSHKLTQRDTRSAHTHTPHRTQTHAYTHPGTRTPTRHVCFLATYQESYTPINPPSTRTPCENTPILPPSSPFLFSSSIGYSLSLSCALSLSPPPPLPPPLAR